MNEVSEFYDEFSKRQIDAGINHRHLSIQRWVEFFGLKTTDRVLEIGCGIGTQTELMLRFLTTGSITALDISKESIDIAEKRLQKYKNKTLIAGDIIQLEITDQFDFILLPDVLEHIPLEQHAVLFRKLEKMLKKKGLMVIHIPDPDSLRWIQKNQPETLQIIDQPIDLGVLCINLEGTSLKIEYLNSYSVYSQDPDYQVLLLRNGINDREYKNRASFMTDSLSRRLKRKVQYITRGFK